MQFNSNSKNYHKQELSSSGMVSSPSSALLKESSKNDNSNRMSMDLNLRQEIGWMYQENLFEFDTTNILDSTDSLPSSLNSKNPFYAKVKEQRISKTQAQKSPSLFSSTDTASSLESINEDHFEKLAEKQIIMTSTTKEITSNDNELIYSGTEFNHHNFLQHQTDNFTPLENDKEIELDDTELTEFTTLTDKSQLSLASPPPIQPSSSEKSYVKKRPETVIQKEMQERMNNFNVEISSSSSAVNSPINNKMKSKKPKTASLFIQPSMTISKTVAKKSSISSLKDLFKISKSHEDHLDQSNISPKSKFVLHGAYDHNTRTSLPPPITSNDIAINLPEPSTPVSVRYNNRILQRYNSFGTPNTTTKYSIKSTPIINNYMVNESESGHEGTTLSSRQSSVSKTPKALFVKVPHSIHELNTISSADKEEILKSPVLKIDKGNENGSSTFYFVSTLDDSTSKKKHSHKATKSVTNAVTKNLVKIDDILLKEPITSDEDDEDLNDIANQYLSEPSSKRNSADSFSLNNNNQRSSFISLNDNERNSIVKIEDEKTVTINVPTKSQNTNSAFGSSSSLSTIEDVEEEEPEDETKLISDFELTTIEKELNQELKIKKQRGKMLKLQEANEFSDTRKNKRLTFSLLYNDFYNQSSVNSRIVSQDYSFMKNKGVIANRNNFVSNTEISTPASSNFSNEERIRNYYFDLRTINQNKKANSFINFVTCKGY